LTTRIAPHPRPLKINDVAEEAAPHRRCAGGLRGRPQWTGPSSRTDHEKRDHLSVVSLREGSAL